MIKRIISALVPTSYANGGSGNKSGSTGRVTKSGNNGNNGSTQRVIKPATTGQARTRG